MTQALELNKLSPQVIEIAERAGRAVLDVYEQDDLGVTHKEDSSPLTQADLASHKLIVAELQKLTPDIPILSEESKEMPVEERRSWSRFWLVDPLDGTKEFVKRNGEFTVNIALIEDGRTKLGVVHAPVLGQTYWAAVSLGAHKRTEGKDEEISVTSFESGTLKVVASRSHAGAETTAFLERLEKNVDGLEVVSKGSSLKLCLVAEGAAHLYPRFGPTMEWDTAAAQCVVEQAGGYVSETDLITPLRYNKQSLLNPYFIVSAVQEAAWLPATTPEGAL